MTLTKLERKLLELGNAFCAALNFPLRLIQQYPRDLLDVDRLSYFQRSLRAASS